MKHNLKKYLKREPNNKVYNTEYRGNESPNCPYNADSTLIINNDNWNCILSLYENFFIIEGTSSITI